MRTAASSVRTGGQLTRKLGAETLPNAAELNALGEDGWELTTVVSEPTQVHF